MNRPGLLAVALLFASALLADPLVPYLVKDLNDGTALQSWTPSFHNKHVLGNVVYFSASGSIPGLWRTDGTAAGTHRVYDGIADKHSFYGAGPIVEREGRIHFPIETVDPLIQWSERVVRTDVIVTDGSTAGTRVTATIPRLSWRSGGAACGANVCFMGLNSLFGFTDGTQEGTKSWFTAPGVETESVRAIVSIGDRVLFNARDEVNGRCMGVYTNGAIGIIECGELWTSDGTLAGTHLVVRQYSVSACIPPRRRGRASLRRP